MILNHPLGVIQLHLFLSVHFSVHFSVQFSVHFSDPFLKLLTEMPPSIRSSHICLKQIDFRSSFQSIFRAHKKLLNHPRPNSENLTGRLLLLRLLFLLLLLLLLDFIAPRYRLGRTGSAPVARGRQVAYKIPGGGSAGALK